MNDATAGPRPKVVHADSTVREHHRMLLGGPPETVTMRSGLVVLEPCESVGRHTTGDREEVLVILSGVGEMRLADGTTHHLAESSVAYCPPATEHSVVNTGEGLLRYVYVVAKARGVVTRFAPPPSPV